jgi:hypothetical protein
MKRQKGHKTRKAQEPCGISSKNFEEALLEAIDEGLSCLGSGKNAVYYHAERLYGIKKWEIPFRVKDFAEALEKIFGPGARLIEIQIMKSLYGKIGVHLRWDEKLDVTFTEYVDALRRSFKRKEQVKSKVLENLKII